MNYFENIEKNVKRKCYLMLAIPLCIMLSGCQGPQKTANTVSATSQQSNAPKGSSSEVSAAECRRDLQALSKVNPQLYSQNKARFDELLNQASVYTSVREGVDMQTKDTVDAMYKYKTRIVCRDIKQMVYQSLINSGESLK